MENYYRIKLKFKNEEISSKIFDSELHVSDKVILIKIIDSDIKSRVDSLFMISEKALSLFQVNFDIIQTEVSLILSESRIYKIESFHTDDSKRFFSIYLTKITLVFPNKHKYLTNQGKAFLNDNGLKIVNTFYSFFTNIRDKNQFSISRMKGMEDFYETSNTITFRPELDFANNEKRGSKEFTITKIPTIYYRFEDLDYYEIRNSIGIICNFLSFCFGIRIYYKKLIYRTEDAIYIYRDTSPENKTFVSDFSVVFHYLNENYNIERVLKTDWYHNYRANEKKFNKAIDNYLHSREVELSASFLLLFNIIEIFNIKQETYRFKFKNNKDEVFKEAFNIISNLLEDDNDFDLLKDKWNGLVSKLEFKPMKSPLEETLNTNNIIPTNLGYSFKQLKRTRDKLTHGSVNTIDEKDLKSQISCLRKITMLLLLSNLGFKEELNY